MLVEITKNMLTISHVSGRLGICYTEKIKCISRTRNPKSKRTGKLNAKVFHNCKPVTASTHHCVITRQNRLKKA